MVKRPDRSVVGCNRDGRMLYRITNGGNDYWSCLVPLSRKVMYKWLERQGEVHRNQTRRGPRPEAKENTVSMSTLPLEVSRMLGRILEPYIANPGGRCVLGLLLRLVVVVCEVVVVCDCVRWWWRWWCVSMWISAAGYLQLEPLM